MTGDPRPEASLPASYFDAIYERAAALAFALATAAGLGAPSEPDGADEVTQA